MNEKILIVDDEKEIADLVTLYLRNEDYSVVTCYTAADAMKVVETTVLDLAIIDIMLPATSGLVISQRIREKHTYPIIMLTAKNSEMDKITGLTLGADDYVTKPFRPLELVARVKAQLRRYKRYNGPHTIEETGILTLSGLMMNSNTREVTLNDQSLALTPTEFSILRILMENKGTVMSSEQLFQQIWQDEYYTKGNNTITVHVRHIREKMNATGTSHQYIKTVWGVGYKFEA